MKKKHKKRIIKKKKRRQFLFDMLLAIFLTICLFNIFFFYFFSIKKVTNNAMFPILKKADIVIVEKKKKTIKRFDVVTVKVNNQYMFGRVIGLPGESIKYLEDFLFINDLPLDEKFLVNQINDAHKLNQFYTYDEESENSHYEVSTIPDNFYFILGDNRPDSTDSRFFGLVPKDQMYGEVKLKLFPLEVLETF